MTVGALGKDFDDGEIIIQQGSTGKCMYVIQDGQVEVVQSSDQGEQHLATLRPGDFFGEMAIFENEVRSATVRAVGKAKILQVDKKTLLRRIKEDPLLAVNLLKSMSHRIRVLDAQLAQLESDA
ncbi:MAG: cyclic nucleotide-binding domain-containing protein [Xanthomonadales bacterium]|nr:cyclic nucleotide-binding domain-containing protein [Xanthomonadales bacterium]NIX12938.1 cyclic nucleotide-binding domain-containing protein [Xanthomonadales bacterium]